MTENCRCPILLAEAEINRMLELGLVSRGSTIGGSGGILAIMVGRLRQAYGCEGPTSEGHCWWYHAVPFGEGLSARNDVPTVGVRTDDGRRNPGLFL
jgi:hypothetical protein